MQKIIAFFLISFLLVVPSHSQSQEPERADVSAAYQENIDFAACLYFTKQEIPEYVLYALVPYDNLEFITFYYGLYDSRGNDDQMSSFFSDMVDKIFNEVILRDNDKFYMAGLKLASFADGEFAETFIEYLEHIIALNPEKFCAMARGQSYSKRFPIKNYLEENNCTNTLN